MDIHAFVSILADRSAVLVVLVEELAILLDQLSFGFVEDLQGRFVEDLWIFGVGGRFVEDLRKPIRRVWARRNRFFAARRFADFFAVRRFAVFRFAAEMRKQPTRQAWVLGWFSVGFRLFLVTHLFDRRAGFVYQLKQATRQKF